MFTVYGQPITFRTPNDSVGRYLIEANKYKVFSDAIGMIASSGGGSGAPAVASIGASNLQAKPADGEVVRSAMPLISANLSAFGQIDAGSVKMRVSGVGLVQPAFDAKSNSVTYQPTQKLGKQTTVIVEATSGGKRVQGQWMFQVDDAALNGPAAPAPSPAPTKK
jgi:hypothetical protein